jgi:GNAT superfamily N-acetyltransferase
MPVRDATREDLPRLIELLSQLSLDRPREDLGPPLPDTDERAFREIDADPRQRLLVLEVDGRLLGSLVLIIVPNLTHEGRPFATVENVVIDSAARGRGYGQLLMNTATDLAREAGCYKLALTSNKERADAHRFYQRLGFRPTHEGFRIEL